MESNTGTNQMLTQIPALSGIDLGARIIEIVVFNKCADLRRPIIIAACDDLPGEVGMTLPSACAEVAVRAAEVQPRRFGIVNADACAYVRLKPPERESPNEIPHECAGINKGGRAGLPE